jgi:nitrilase
MTRLAIVQKPPAFLDRTACLRIAVDSVAEAAAGGAKLVIFPEAFVPGYPAWIWRLRPGGDMALSEKLHRTLLANAVDLGRDDLAPLRDAARSHGVTVTCGVHERDGEFSRGTIYNTVVAIGPDGSVLNRHRKLMPTNPERMVWGQGDATGLRPVESDCGRIGTLICWESYMPLARYALYAQGLDVYVAPTYDSGDRWVATMQHIAREAGCWVAGSGVAFRGADIRDAAPGLRDLYPDADEWVNGGDSLVVAPGGKVLAGPMRNEVGLLYADIGSEAIDDARRTLDVAGHYGRPDLFSLHVNTAPLAPVNIFGSPPQTMFRRGA